MIPEHRAQIPTVHCSTAECSIYARSHLRSSVSSVNGKWTLWSSARTFFGKKKNPHSALADTARLQCDTGNRNLCPRQQTGGDLLITLSSERKPKTRPTEPAISSFLIALVDTEIPKILMINLWSHSHTGEDYAQTQMKVLML